MRIAALAALALAFVPDAAADIDGLRARGPLLIDRRIEEAWKDAGVTPAGVVDDAGFLRRAHLDLLGSIPTGDEVLAFLKDARPDKRALKVDELLARPAFAENWAAVWENLLVGYNPRNQGDIGPGLFNWLRDEAFAKNLPFDQVARALVTAKGVSTENGSTAFLLALSRRGGGSIGIASKVSRVFLGTQIACAQCHDHPFDRYTQEDFHGVVAFFARVKNRKVDSKNSKDNRYELYDDAKGEASMGEGKAKKTVPPLFLDGTRPDAGKDRREEFARMMVRPENLQFARATVNRLWGHFFGRGFVDPVDDFSGRTKSSHPGLLDELSKEFVDSKFDLKALMRSITTSRPYQLSSRRPAAGAPHERFFAYAQVRPLSPEQLVSALRSAMGPGLNAPAGGDARKNAQSQDQLLSTFRRAFGDPENVGVPRFDGTINQALLLMNGQTLTQGIVGKGGRLAEILAKKDVPEDRLELLFATILGRLPMAKERLRLLEHVQAGGNKAAAYEDAAWVLLNSSEFLFNR